MSAVRKAMEAASLEVLLLSVGADLPWLTGYEAMPLERLTMLVLGADETPTLVVPALEAPRVEHDPSLLLLRPYSETEDPTAIVAGLVGSRQRLGISDRTWAAPLLRLQGHLPRACFEPASAVVGPLRAVKDDAEIAVLRAAGGAADRVAAALFAGEIGLVGRAERAVSAEIAERLLDEGHSRVDFAIVASGPNSASPHHEPGSRVIEVGDPVVCDFGGLFRLGDEPGYCSDTTRTVIAGGVEPDAGFRRLYDVLEEAQAAAVAGALVGTPCAEVDRIGRAIIADAGYGDLFIHRIGHGIGIEGHEDPYLVEGNETPLVSGHAFSVEPGIYTSGSDGPSYGARIEDIVVATASGPVPLNNSDHSLRVVDA